MPRAVHLMALGVFAMVTSEFAVAGLMPQMADGLSATIPQIGYLITAFAVAMAAGGPFLTIAVLKLRPKPALMVLFAIFLVGNLLAATAPSYPIMMAARIITGIAAQAFFGVAISLAVRLTPPQSRGRAIAVVMNGLMVGTLLGLPLSTLIGEHLGWRAAFWAVSAVAALAALATMIGVPRLERAEGDGGDFRQEMRVFTKPKLWLVFATSTLIIGATFSAFSYLNPILTQVTGFSAGTVPLLLIAYGAATVVGNNIVGRLADRHTVSVQLWGLALNLIFLTGFALLAHLSIPAVVLMLGIGLVGVTMNPAMVTRVQRTGNARPLVNTVHSSFITLGVIIGSFAGGMAIDDFGLRAPLWLGAGLAALGILTLVPDLIRRSAAKPAPAPNAPAAGGGPAVDARKHMV
ncbi:MFS transporter [Streptosporangium roseum]|uniref:Major facilitator superfamily transporter n=1 Tax=Streptosporangium roseum (strain ATCC 12428 / DSM 43021 / JCM 3005 / KCTC 9067 / NCIMB 10171 / NRRL 2505 / NI 9100) TaxID=479432 RepID=D2B1R4_STRRD|nr:MFS transporter [Streptosporangium roseum]ACZ87366.1 major facilitator superfamily transporter [Streptosporangium roseum DSM 43021]